MTTTVTVGPTGQYSTINAALQAINPTESNPYIVSVQAGTYTEAVSLPSWVTLAGSGINATYVIYSQNDENSTISINPDDFSQYQHIEIQNLTITRIGGAAYADGSAPTAALSMQAASNVSVTDVAIVASFPVTNAKAIPMGIYITQTPLQAIQFARVSVTVTGNAGALIGVAATYMGVTPGSYPVGMAGCQISVSSAIAQKCIGVASINGGAIRISGLPGGDSVIDASTSATGGISVAVMASPIGFQDALNDSYVDLWGVVLTGDVIGHFVTHKSVKTPAGNPYPFNDQVVTVGQDIEATVGMLPLNALADFGTIKSALAWVQDKATAQTPYVIKLFPGTYAEHVDMIPYVDIVGSGRNITQITSGATPHNYVVTAASHSSLSHLDVTSNGPSSYAWMVHAHQCTDFEIRNCWLEGEFNQSGPGTAVGLQVSSGSDVRVRNSFVFAGSTGAIGINVTGNSKVEVQDSIVSAEGAGEAPYAVPPQAAISTSDTSTAKIHRSVVQASDANGYTLALQNQGTSSSPQIELALSQVAGTSQGLVQTVFCVGSAFTPFMGSEPSGSPPSIVPARPRTRHRRRPAAPRVREARP